MMRACNPMLHVSAMVIVCLTGFTAHAQVKESKGKYDSGGKDINYEMFEPTAAGKHAAVVILPGTFGLLPPWGDDIRMIAKGLAENKIVALIPLYFDRTGTTPGGETTVAIALLAPRHGAEWNAAVEDGIEFLHARSNVDGDRLGLLGLSLGGNRALTIAMQPSRTIKIQRVVEYFAPITRIRLAGDVAKLPTLQIHHGDADTIVPPSDTKELVRRLKRKGRVEGTDFEVFWYPGAGHGFKGDDLKNSRKETIEFFKAL